MEVLQPLELRMTLGGWDESLSLAQRCYSLPSKDQLGGCLPPLHAVQLSASSDSALLGPTSRRGQQRSSGSGAQSDGAAVLGGLSALHPVSASSSLSAQLQQIHTWDRFDVFRVAELTQGRPLRTVTVAIFEALGLLNSWKLDQRKVEAFLMEAEASYGRSNPYHNSIHAADVVQATFLMLRSVRQPQFTKLEVFGLLLAAVIHDIAHPGVTNDFLAKTTDPLVMAHGADSTNEKHHLATAFSIAAKPETNIFSGLSPAETEKVRGFIRSSVLCTDMAQHKQLSEQLAAARQRAEQSGGATASSPADRALLLRALLHTADLSNPARPLPLGALWGRLVAKEFLAQGDQERALGLPVTPACDRATVVVSTSQLRFIDMFLRPLLQQMQGYLGEALRLQLLRRLGDTEEHWRRHQARVAAGAEEPCGSE